MSHNIVYTDPALLGGSARPSLYQIGACNAQAGS